MLDLESPRCDMERVANIRTEEKRYHDMCYDSYNLFEPLLRSYK